MMEQTNNHRRELTLLALVMLLATLAVFRGVLSGQIISNITYLYNFQPWGYYDPPPKPYGNPIMSDMVDSIGFIVSQGTRLRNGELALWDYSHQLGQLGSPNLLYYWFYPPRAVGWMLFGPATGWTVEILLRFFLGGIFMYLFMRRLGINPYVATACSIGFTFGSNNIGSHQGGFSAVPLAATAAFYTAERLIQSNRWRDAIFLAFGLYFLGSSGYLSVVFFFSYILFIYVVVRALFSKGTRLGILFKFCIAGLAAILLISPGLFPTIEFFRSGLDMGYRANKGLAQLHANSFVNIFSANIFGDPLLESKRWQWGTYINTSVFVGSLVALSAFSFSLARLFQKRDIVSILLGILLVFLFHNIYLMGYEKIEAITNTLPLFHGNRPSFQKAVFQFLFSVFGALGLDWLWRQEKIGKLGLVSGLFFLIAGCAAIYWIGDTYETLGPAEINRKYLLRSLAVSSVGIAIIFAIMFKTQLLKVLPISSKSMLRILGIGLVLVFLAESILHSRRWISYAETKHFFPKLDITEYLDQNLGSSRIVSVDRTAIPEMMTGYGYPVAAGRGSVPASFRTLLQTAAPSVYATHPTQTYFLSNETDFSSSVWDLAGVKYFITSKSLPKRILELPKDKFQLHSFKGANLIERLSATSNAIPVSDAVVTKVDKEFATNFASGRWEVRNQVVIDDSSILLPSDSPNIDQNREQTNGKVLSYRQLSDRIEIDIEFIKPGYLVLSNYFSPGWKATSTTLGDLEIFRAYDFLQGIRVSKAGRHTIVLTFFPKGLGLGVCLFIAGILLIGIMVLGARKESKNSD